MIHSLSTRIQYVLLIVSPFLFTSGASWKSIKKNVHPKFLESPPNCNPHNYTLMLNSPDLCKTEDVYLLILVRSIPQNQLRRKSIRRTWGSLIEVNDKNVRVAFLFGNNTEELNKYIKDEYDNYHDVIQGSFPESYRTLDLKTVMAWKWVMTYCSRAIFVIVCNDEMFIDIFKTMSYLKKPIDNFYTCWMEREGNRPNRNLKHKHGVSLKDYPGKRYPAFCNGNGYIASQNVIRKLYEMSLNTPSFMPDDVWTGVLSAKLGLVISNNHVQFSINRNSRLLPRYNSRARYDANRVCMFPLDRLPTQCEVCVVNDLWPKIVRYNTLPVKVESPSKNIYPDNYLALFLVLFIITVIALMRHCGFSRKITVFAVMLLCVPLVVMLGQNPKTICNFIAT